jgi:hypothetical protein
MKLFSHLAQIRRSVLEHLEATIGKKPSLQAKLAGTSLAELAELESIIAKHQIPPRALELAFNIGRRMESLAILTEPRGDMQRRLAAKTVGQERMLLTRNKGEYTDSTPEDRDLVIEKARKIRKDHPTWSNNRVSGAIVRSSVMGKLSRPFTKEAIEGWWKKDLLDK